MIEELQRCRALVDQTEAIEKAGHCAEYAGLKEAVLDGVELFGHDMGYLWAVFYSEGKVRRYFALINADGTPLAKSAASLVIKADRTCKGSLHRLHYLLPPPPVPDREALRNAVSDYEPEKPSDALIDSLVEVLKSGGRIETARAAVASTHLAFRRRPPL